MNLQQIEKDFIIIQEFEYEGKKTLYARDKSKHLPIFFEESGEGFVFVSSKKYFELKDIFERKVVVDHVVRKLGKRFIVTDSPLQSEFYQYLDGNRYFEYMEYIPDKNEKSGCEFPFSVAFEEAFVNSRQIPKQMQMNIIEVIKSAIKEQLDEIEKTGNRRSFYLQKLKSKPIKISFYEFNTKKYIGYCSRKDSSHIAINSIKGQLQAEALLSTLRHEVNHSLTSDAECTGVSDEKGNFVAVNEAMTEACSHTKNGKIPPQHQLSYEEYTNVLFSLGVKPSVISNIYFSRFSQKQKIDLLVDEIVGVNKTSREMAYKALYQMDIIFNIHDILESSNFAGLSVDSAIKSLRATLFEIQLSKFTEKSIENFEMIPQLLVRDFGLTFYPFDEMKNSRSESRMEKVKKQFLKNSIENCRLKKDGIVLPNGLFVYHNKMNSVCSSVGINYENHLNKRIADVESENRIKYEREKRGSDSFDSLLARALVEENTTKTLVEMYSVELTQVQKEQIATFLCIAITIEGKSNFSAHKKQIGEIFFDVSRGLQGGASMTPISIVSEMMKFATMTKNRELLFEIFENFSQNKNIRDEKSFLDLSNLYSGVDLFRENCRDYFDIKYEIVKNDGKSDHRLFPNVSISQLAAPGVFSICSSSYKHLRDSAFLESELGFLTYAIRRAIAREDVIMYKNLYDFASRRTADRHRDQQLFILKLAIKNNFEVNPVNTTEFLRRSGNIFLFDESLPSELVLGELPKFLIPLLKSNVVNEHLFVERDFVLNTNGLEVVAKGHKMTYLAKLLCSEKRGAMRFDVRKVSKLVDIVDSCVPENERKMVRDNLITGIKRASQTLGFAEFNFDERT